MRGGDCGSRPRTWKEIILPFVLLHCHCVQPKWRRSNAVLSEPLRSQLPTSALHPLTPPTHASLSSPTPPTVHMLSPGQWPQRVNSWTNRNHSFISFLSSCFLSSWQITRCKYNDRITDIAWHVKVVFVCEKHLDFLRYVLERLPNTTCNF